MDIIYSMLVLLLRTVIRKMIRSLTQPMVDEEIHRGETEVE